MSVYHRQSLFIFIFIFLIVCWCPKCSTKNPKTLHANVWLMYTDRTCDKRLMKFHRNFENLPMNFCMKFGTFSQIPRESLHYSAWNRLVPTHWQLTVADTLLKITEQHTHCHADNITSSLQDTLSHITRLKIAIKKNNITCIQLAIYNSPFRNFIISHKYISRQKASQSLWNRW